MAGGRVILGPPHDKYLMERHIKCWARRMVVRDDVATRYTRRRQSVDVRTVHGSSLDHAVALREGYVDVAIVLSPPEDRAGLASEVLTEIPLAAALQLG